MIGVSRLALAWRLAWRECVAGELNVLALALIVAVCAMSSVGFFAERVERGLALRVSQLLAADLVLNADAPVPAALRQEALGRGLVVSESTTFPSMIMAHDQAQLVSFKAVDAQYPLRGQMTVRLLNGQVVQGATRPAPGCAWADPRLMARLGLRLGDSFAAGNTHLRLTGEVVREPDGALDFYSFIPRLMLNRADLPATGLVQTGTRARWRLMVAGEPAAVTSYGAWLAARMPRGARIENAEEARPEVRDSMNRARRFLGLTAMLTVALSAAALALAVRRYLARHWPAVAVLRAMGLTASEVAGLFAVLLLGLALACGGLGTMLGFLLQEGLTRLALAASAEGLPPPGWHLWLAGPASAVLLLFALALPPLMAVRRVPALAVLRADFALPERGLAATLLALLVLLGLAAWQIADFDMVLYLLGGLTGFCILAGGVAWVMVKLVRRLAAGGGGAGWRFGVASLARRPWLAVVQVLTISVGMMALLTLTVVRTDLIDSWQQRLPHDAPDQFVINLQPAQRADFLRAFAAARLPLPELAPMVRARLVAIDGHALDPAAMQDGEARRLAEREFNLSWRDDLPPGNRLMAGRWWGAGAGGQFSVESGLAAKLGIRLGDQLSFDIAGTRFVGTVTSLRRVPWDSFRVNFFVLAPSHWFEGQAASLVSSFYLPQQDQAFANRLVRQFPNLTLIDVSAILTELRDVIERLARVVEAMFALALAAGLLVLWAAQSATRDERMFDAALLVTLGASHRQVRAVLLAELGWLGAFTGLLAGVGAMLLGSLAAVKLFDLPFALNPALPALGLVLGMVLVPLAGWPRVRRVLREPPANVLRG